MYNIPTHSCCCSGGLGSGNTGEQNANIPFNYTLLHKDFNDWDINSHGENIAELFVNFINDDGITQDDIFKDTPFFNETLTNEETGVRNETFIQYNANEELYTNFIYSNRPVNLEADKSRLISLVESTNFTSEEFDFIAKRYSKIYNSEYIIEQIEVAYKHELYDRYIGLSYEISIPSKIFLIPFYSEGKLYLSKISFDHSGGGSQNNIITHVKYNPRVLNDIDADDVLSKISDKEENYVVICNYTENPFTDYDINIIANNKEISKVSSNKLIITNAFNNLLLTLNFNAQNLLVRYLGFNLAYDLSNNDLSYNTAQLALERNKNYILDFKFVPQNGKDLSNKNSVIITLQEYYLQNSNQYY